VFAPEKLARFRVAAPSDYESKLLAALAEVGKVHLKRSLEGFEPLPPLLAAAAEGRLEPESLDVEEALRVVRSSLRPGSELLLKFEELYAEYAGLEKLKALADALNRLKVPFESLGKPRFFTVVDLLVVKEEDVGDAAAELAALGATVSRQRLPGGEYAVVAVYSAERAGEVEALKRKYGVKLTIPPWFYEGYEAAVKRVALEQLSLRKRMVEMLAEIAAYLRGLLDVRRAEWLEAVAEAYRGVQRLDEYAEELRLLLLEAAAVALASRVAGGERPPWLPEEISKVLRALDSGEAVDPASAREVLAGLCQQSGLERLASLLDRYARLTAAERLASKLGTSSGEERSLLVACAKREALLNPQAAKGLLKALTGYGGSLVVKEEAAGALALAVEAPAEVSEALAGELAALLGAEVLGPYRSAAELERVVERRKFLVKRSIAACLVLEAFSKAVPADAASWAGGSILQAFERLEKLEDVEPTQPPEGDWGPYIKEIAQSAKRVGEGLEQLKDELEKLKALVAEGEEPDISKVSAAALELAGELERLRAHSWLVEILYRASPFVEELRFFRRKGVVVVEGYVPVRYLGELKGALERALPRLLYFEAEEVPRRAEAPTYIEHRGLLKYLYAVTAMRGTPAYWEVDPTLIFTILFAAMFGMMFGDVGQGALVALFGAWLLKTRYRLLGISEEGAASVGALALLAGASSVMFGVLYGFTVFLKPLTEPVISPIRDIFSIIAIALWFGFAQLCIAMLLNVVNMLRRGERLEALLGGTGVAGLVFYASGAVIAYRLAGSGMNFAVLESPELAPWVSLLASSALLVLAYGFYEARKGGLQLGARALGELIEMLVAFPANSLSYIRLAAFAIAHEVFGVMAEAMAPFVGALASLAVANFLALVIEGLAVGIQAMRLVYYEFSTKFFKGEGLEFQPLSAPGKLLGRTRNPLLHAQGG
jgi:V/A-type H+-transporting ATPase subunit I